MADERVEQAWDERGRGILAAEYQRRAGFDPASTTAGFASFARAIDRAGSKGHEWPDQFRPMLEAVVAAVVMPILEAERAARAAEVIELRTSLDAARRAYAELKAEVVELRKAVRGQAPTVPVRPRQAALAGGK